MKKFSKLTLFSLCLTPLLLYSASVPPPSYSITGSSSDMQLGYVQGFDKDAMNEGKKVTISAIPTKDNSFICWIKDNNIITSNETNLTLTYNKKNAGHYTAVFEEPNISQMLYAGLSDFSFKPSGYTKVEYSINTALLSSGSNDYHEFAEGSYNTKDEYNINSKNVLYFGGAGDEYVYLIKINFKLYDSKGSETTYEYTLKAQIDKTDFTDKSGIQIIEDVEALNTKLTLNFNKLSVLESNSYNVIENGIIKGAEEKDDDTPVTPPPSGGDDEWTGNI